MSFGWLELFDVVVVVVDASCSRSLVELIKSNSRSIQNLVCSLWIFQSQHETFEHE